MFAVLKFIGRLIPGLLFGGIAWLLVSHFWPEQTVLAIIAGISMGALGWISAYKNAGFWDQFISEFFGRILFFWLH